MSNNRFSEVKEFNDQSNVFLNSQMTFKDIYKLSILRNKHTLAFEYYDENNIFRSFTYKKIDKLTKEYASKLSTLLKDKDRSKPIVLKLFNSPYWCALLYAIIMNGFAPLLINAKIKKEGTLNLINKTDANAIITDDPFSYPILKIDINCLNEVKEDKKFIPTWSKDIIFCSSGTTGDIKLVIYNDKNLIYQIISGFNVYKETQDIVYPRKHGNLKLLAMIPFHHIFGFVAIFLWFTFYGKTIVIPSNNNIKQIQSICIKRRITHIFSVPLFWDSIAKAFVRKKEQMDAHRINQIDQIMKERLEGKEITYKLIDAMLRTKLLGNNIRFCISGGGYLSKETSKIINALGYPLYNGFGMSEIGVTSVELSNDINERIKCSIGKPFKNVDYIIKNKQLLVKSPAIHYEEYINRKRQPTKLTKDGYFETNDVMYLEKDGRFYIKGRLKDVIINADGENVYPDELELYFTNIKNILNYTILGLKDSNNSQRENIVFIAQVSNGCKKAQLLKIKEEIVSVDKLPNNSHIDEVYFTTQNLPISNSIKVKRNEIKEAIAKKCKNYFVVDEIKAIEIDKSNTVKLETINLIRKIYSNVLSLNENKITNCSHWIKDLGGDSMLFIELTEQIEQAFNFVIPCEHYTRCMTVQDLALYISENKIKEGI